MIFKTIFIQININSIILTDIGKEKENELSNLELDLSKLEMDSNACLKRIADVEKRIPELRYIRIIFSC